MTGDRVKAARLVAIGMLECAGVVGRRKAVRAIAEAFAREEVPPEWAREWFAHQAWEEECEEVFPSRRGRGRDGLANRRRDVWVECVIRVLVEDFDLPATRNPASQHESACSIMQKALAATGIDLRERAIEKIWAAKPLGPDQTLAALKRAAEVMGVELSAEDLCRVWGSRWK